MPVDKSNLNQFSPGIKEIHIGHKIHSGIYACARSDVMAFASFWVQLKLSIKSKNNT